MSGTGLGTGLSALFGEAAVESAPGEARRLPLAKIEPKNDQPRTHFDDEALGELADSIREHGLLQPITVRELDGGFYQIIAGERRWRAARMAGLLEVPVMVVEADDKKAMELAMVENLQREDLNPVEEAKGYRTLMAEYGLTQEKVAAAVGKSRPVVANALRLLDLPEPVLALVESGTRALSHARALLELDSPGEQQRLAELAAQNGLTVRELTAQIKRTKGGKSPEPRRKAAETDVDYVAEAETALTKKLGRKVKIVDGKRKGRLEIEYYGAEDFDALYKALSGIGRDLL